MENKFEDEIDFPIDKINRFLDEYVFEVPFLPDMEAKIPVKIKLKRLRRMILVGEWTTFLMYDFYIVPGTESQNTLSSIFFNEKDSKEIPYKVPSTLFDTAFLRANLNELIRNFLKYWNINYLVSGEDVYNLVPFSVSSKKMNESLILESKYDSVVRKVVKDITQLIKYNQVGEFTLPEDVSGEMVYDFPQLETKFSVEVTISEDESVDGFIVDGEYYSEEDTIEIGITLDPTKGRTIIQDLIGDLNEIIMHEITHISQYERGFDFENTEHLTPYEYYTQEHELEAQKKGFNRRAKSEKKSLENVMDDWFKKNKGIHNLNPEEISSIKSKISDYKY